MRAKDAEVLGLLALMEIQASRLPARTGRDGASIPLPEQDLLFSSLASQGIDVWTHFGP